MLTNWSRVVTVPRRIYIYHRDHLVHSGLVLEVVGK